VRAVSRWASAAVRTALVDHAMEPSDLRNLQNRADRVCDLLKALSNRVRLMLACQLAEGEKSVSELQEFVGISQSAVSQHLALLRQHKLVATRREGQSVYYVLASPDAAAIMKALHDQFCGKRR
jgi:DNA-binding transcriptional ArsR family regulator